MNFQKPSASISRYFLVPAIAAVFLASGCGGPKDNHISTDAAIKDIQILGDSYFDLGGYIHDELERLSGVEYYDRSQTNAELSHISLQIDAALAENEADQSYRLQTIIINGGANDLQYPCKTNTNPSTSPGTKCGDALAASKAAITEMIARMSTEVDYIVWAGRYYMSEPTAPQEVVDAHNENIKEACTQNEIIEVTNCYFVEVRGSENDGDELRWSYSEATPEPEGGEFIKKDGQHLTKKGGENIANLIWQFMEAQNIHR